GSAAEAMERARQAIAEQFDNFARNTIEYLQRERDLLFGGAGLPSLRHELAGRQVLVVVRGSGYRQDLAALRPYIREVRPVLLGVDGGADALLEAGYRPDLIVGDMDSVTERSLALAHPGRTWWGRTRTPTEVVVHAYPGGHAPGAQRMDDLEIPHTVVEATGTSEDVAYMLAHEGRAELIVTVGSHANLREFLDKGREGMASTFLVRLRVGEILMDAKGVSRLYPGRVRGRDAALLIGAAFFAMGTLVLVSEPLRLYMGQIVKDLFAWIGGLV
ncbi:MAG: putative cytokinetic ring protein SteA, partial [Actinomycetota bacterium]